MKKSVYFLLASLICTSAYAQEFTERTQQSEDGKRQYKSYLTNDWNDNLFVGGGAGISTRFSLSKSTNFNKAFINPDLELYLMKWFTPVVGIRLGYQGFNGREGLSYYNPETMSHTPFPYDPTDPSNPKGPGTMSYGSMHLYGDFMWNIINTFQNYKRDRFYTISLYLGGGYLRLFDNKTNGNKGLGSSCYDREFTLSVGLYNTFRITDRLLGIADLRWDNHASRYREVNTAARTNVLALSIGVAYNLFRTTWTDVATVNETNNVSVAEAQASAKVAMEIAEKTKTENLKLAEMVKTLNLELKELPYERLKARAANADQVLYFYIDDDKLNFSETYHFNQYVEDMLKADPDHVFYVTGSADKGTGTENRNTDLSTRRALYVKSLLMNNFNVKEENIKVSNVISDKHLDAGLDRCVIIESKAE